MDTQLKTTLTNLKAMPIAADLVLREQANPEAILQNGQQLAEILLEAANRFETPLVVPIMDLTLEKQAICDLMQVPPAQADTFHLEVPLADGEGEAIVAAFDPFDYPQMKANIEATRYVAQVDGVYPVGMSIGPFSLLVKLLKDPITATYLVGMGLGEADDPSIKLLNQGMALCTGIIYKYMEAQLVAGAKLFFIAEPAANIVYLSPKQVQSGSDVFEQVVMKNLRVLNELIHAHGAELFFHCCGELIPEMLQAFVSLKPAVLSLGSSRRLWEDAKLVDKETFLFGNLPSKKFFSDTEITANQVYFKAKELLAKMAEAGHPFILGSECDILSVKGAEATILKKVYALIDAAREMPCQKIA